MISKTQEEIMADWNTEKYDHPLVSIRCITYNQKNYIEQALDSFLSQVTDFPFEVVVHDDASKDGTEDIIRKYEEKYPAIIKALYETENQYSKGNGILRKIVNKELHGDYVAICEGDDFWIDDCKLQKQMDFLLENKDYGMCYTNFNIYYQKDDRYEYDLFTSQPEKYKSDFNIEEWILALGYVGPMTWVIRKDIWDSYKTMPSCDGTFVLFAHFITSTKVKCMKDETTAVYRILSESAAHSDDLSKIYSRYMNLHSVQIRLAKRYNLEKSFLRKIDSAYYKKRYKIICILGDKKERENCKKYCSGLKFSLIYFLTKFGFIRNLILSRYNKSKNNK